MDVLTEKTKASGNVRNMLRSMLSNKVFKTGSFQLKSGITSPFYIDLRQSFSHPTMLKAMADALHDLIVASEIEFDAIVGVPYAALPFSTLLAVSLNKPLLVIRKEAKDYGTKKLIEGEFSEGQKVIIIEDVVTTGGSIKTVVKTLRDHGLVISDVFCLLDRQQGGFAALETDGISGHSLMNMELIMTFMRSLNAIDDELLSEIIKTQNLPFTSVEKFSIEKVDEDLNKMSTTQKVSPFLARAKTVTGCRKRIYDTMIEKQSNLCLAADYEESAQIIKLAEVAGPHIMALKIHSDLIKDFNSNVAERLRQLADRFRFLLFEDRKFADTGATNILQLTGSHNIAKWADIVTVHGIQGSDGIAVFRKFIEDESAQLSGLLIIAQLSTKGSLTALPGYTEAVVAIGDENQDIVAGYICQSRVSSVEDMLHWTPGVNMASSSDGRGQQWRGPVEALCEQQNDIVIVGRGITSNAKPEEAVCEYKKEAWDALIGRSCC